MRPAEALAQVRYIITVNDVSKRLNNAYWLLGSHASVGSAWVKGCERNKEYEAADAQQRRTTKGENRTKVASGRVDRKGCIRIKWRV
jgi:hypothetical protein